MSRPTRKRTEEVTRSPNGTTLRQHLAHLLDWSSAHPSMSAAFDALPPPSRGRRPDNLPHSPWELLEHIRLSQRDILDFCRDAGYTAPSWPDDYWPPTPAPPSDDAWERSLAGARADCEALQTMALDPDGDLFTPIPHGDGQTLLRELLLVADHTAYHVGQVILVRRALGVWTPTS